MLAATPEAQPQIDLVSIAHTIVSSALRGAWEAVTSSPVFGALFVLVVVCGATRSARRAMYSGWGREPVRRFSRVDKARILARAGGRCEHHYPLFGRCRTTDRLEADHVHPWSRGGDTAVSNGQALCHRHNTEKRAKVPFNRQLRALERRRAAYFPADEVATVARRTVASPPVRQRAA